MTPIKRLAYLFHVLIQEGRTPTSWLISMVELIVRSDQGDVATQAAPTSATALRLSEQLLGDEVNLFQRPLELHYLAEERCRLERREAAFLVQAGWVTQDVESVALWRKGDSGWMAAAAAMKQEGART